MKEPPLFAISDRWNILLNCSFTCLVVSRGRARGFLAVDGRQQHRCEADEEYFHWKGELIWMKEAWILDRSGVALVSDA